MEYKTKNGYRELNSKQIEQIYKFSEGYKKFLNDAKTEREAVIEMEKLAQKKGFVNVEDKKVLKPGDKVYYINREKNIVFCIIGKKEIELGTNIIVSHIDSPRLDLKQNPLYEEEELALLKTHYYGGIKKYQWASIPLALHGVVFLKDGSKVTINIGEAEDDPQFLIGDLLPHLDKNAQRDRKSEEVIKGEELRVIFGSVPSKNKEEKNEIKLAILKKLNEQYGMIEEDFLSAELEVVPANKARDIGLDRGLVGGYGQDDRVCAYTSVMAILDVTKTPEKTLICFLTDKEEIGSMGSTGLQSQFIEYMLTDMIYKLKGGFNQKNVTRLPLEFKSIVSRRYSSGRSSV